MNRVAERFVGLVREMIARRPTRQRRGPTSSHALPSFPATLRRAARVHVSSRVCVLLPSPLLPAAPLLLPLTSSCRYRKFVSVIDPLNDRDNTSNGTTAECLRSPPREMHRPNRRTIAPHSFYLTSGCPRSRSRSLGPSSRRASNGSLILVARLFARGQLLRTRSHPRAP